MSAIIKSEVVDRVRSFIKDFDKNNTLLKYSEENTEIDIDMYVDMAIGFIGSLPPFIGFDTIETLPKRFESLLVYQAVVECLISNSILYARNDISFNNGGINTKVVDGSRYLNMLQILMSNTERYTRMFLEWKKNMNLEMAYGNVSSPYALLGGGTF